MHVYLYLQLLLFQLLLRLFMFVRAFVIFIVHVFSCIHDEYCCYVCISLYMYTTYIVCLCLYLYLLSCSCQFQNLAATIFQKGEQVVGSSSKLKCRLWLRSRRLPFGRRNGRRGGAKGRKDGRRSNTFEKQIFGKEGLPPFALMRSLPQISPVSDGRTNGQKDEQVKQRVCKTQKQKQRFEIHDCFRVFLLVIVSCHPFFRNAFYTYSIQVCVQIVCICISARCMHT